MRKNTLPNYATRPAASIIRSAQSDWIWLPLSRQIDGGDPAVVRNNTGAVITEVFSLEGTATGIWGNGYVQPDGAVYREFEDAGTLNDAVRAFFNFQTIPNGGLLFMGQVKLGATRTANSHVIWGGNRDRVANGDGGFELELRSDATEGNAKWRMKVADTSGTLAQFDTAANAVSASEFRHFACFVNCADRTVTLYSGGEEDSGASHAGSFDNGGDLPTTVATADENNSGVGLLARPRYGGVPTFGIFGNDGGSGDEDHQLHDLHVMRFATDKSADIPEIVGTGARCPYGIPPEWARLL